MAWPLVLYAAGTALQMFGQAQANADQSAAEAKNAAFLREQEMVQRAATDREILLQTRQQDVLRGEQKGTYAGAGVDIGSGSALAMLSEQEAFAIEERAAIRTDGDLKSKLAHLRAEDSQNTSDTLGSFGYNFRQVLGTGLKAAGTMYAMSGSPKTRVSKAGKVGG